MKIFFTGASGVGKSTLVERLQKLYPHLFRPQNFTRPMHSALGFPTNSDITNEVQFATTAFMTYQIITHDDIIYDRCTVDSLVYTQLAKNITDEQYKYHLESFKSIFENLEDAYYFYIPIEFELEEDGIRSKDIEFQKKTDKLIKEFLIENDINFYEITGTVEERMTKILKILGD